MPANPKMSPEVVHAAARALMKIVDMSAVNMVLVLSDDKGEIMHAANISNEDCVRELKRAIFAIENQEPVAVDTIHPAN